MLDPSAGLSVRIRPKLTIFSDGYNEARAGLLITFMSRTPSDGKYIPKVYLLGISICHILPPA